MLAHVAGALAAQERFDDGDDALLHAALFPLAASRGGAVGGAVGGSSAAAPNPGPAACALLALLRRASCTSDAVTLSVVGLCLLWHCDSSRGHPDGGVVVASVLASLREAGVSDSGSALPAALSSGLVGLLNSLSVTRSEGGGLALGAALSGSLAFLPLDAPSLLAAAVGLLSACIAACARVEPCDAHERPLRVLYSSDARVLVDIALRCVADVDESGSERAWAAALTALRPAINGYRDAEVGEALQQL